MPEKSVKRPKKSSALNALKRNLSGKEGTVFEIVSDVKNVNPEQWRNPSQAEELARMYEQRIKQYKDEHEQRIKQYKDEHEQRIKQVMDAYKAYRDEYEQRIKQFVDAYKDAMKNRSSNVDEWIQKYGENVDRKSD